VKLRIARGSVSETYVESCCRYDICQFRSLLLAAPGNVFLRCEIWVVSPNAIHCYEVLADTIREVAAFARWNSSPGVHHKTGPGHPAPPHPEDSRRSDQRQAQSDLPDYRHHGV
jgi:hypothetical protein